ncbi:hypothetical protein GUF81_06300, partial [Xanthomonas citri pv. citri]|nr:hypothetical protein [Xanthomonas citri pv. citri]
LTHISDCRAYYVCNGSEPIMHRCPPQRFYNPQHNSCLFFEENCIRDPVPYRHCRFTEL